MTEQPKHHLSALPAVDESTIAAIRMAGEVIGLQMGLSFATFLDPASGLNMPILAQLLNLLTLTGQSKPFLSNVLRLNKQLNEQRP